MRKQKGFIALNFGVRMLDMFKIFLILGPCLLLFTNCKSPRDLPDQNPSEHFQELSLLQRLQASPKNTYKKLVNQAIENGEDLSAVASDGTTVLHYLVSCKGNADLVNNIISEYPLLIKHKNNKNLSPKHIGCLRSLEYLDLFIKHGYDLDLNYSNNNTLFYKLAALHNFVSIEKLLIYRGELGMLDFLETKNKPKEETAFQKLCSNKYKKQCHKLLDTLLEKLNYSDLLKTRIEDLKNKLLTQPDDNSDDDNSSDDDNNSDGDNSSDDDNNSDDEEALDPSKPAPTPTKPSAPKSKEEIEKETKFLAPWRALKSDLAGVNGKILREQRKEEGIKKFLALNISDLNLLLEQDWVWTSLLGDLKKELAPKLTADALNTLVKTLTNSALAARVSDLDMTLSTIIDEITPDDPELLDKLESVVFGARFSSRVGESIEKKLRAFMSKNKSSRANDINKMLKIAANKRKSDAKNTLEQNHDSKTNYYGQLTPNEIAKILKNDFRDKNFWSPLLGSPHFVFQMPVISIEKLFQLVSAAYKSDPLPGLSAEPLVILSHACRKLDPKDINFEKYFRAITEGAKDNPREILLKVLKNQVQSYSGASKKIFNTLLETLNTKRINNAQVLLSTELKNNKIYQNEADKADIQPATMAYKNALSQTSIDDQNNSEEKIAGYVLYANRNKLDILYKQLSRKETGLILEHNIKQCLAWALSYLSEDKMLISLELENFWKLISAYPEIIGFGLTPTNLGLLFKKLDDFQEQKRRSNLGVLLKEVVEKLKKPKTELHEALDKIEKAVANTPDAKYMNAIISKVRNLPANKR